MRRIYKTTNLINGLIYVGKQESNTKNYLGSGSLFKKILKKFGRENFINETLEIVPIEISINQREKYWIKILNSIDPNIGYNLSTGGENSTLGLKLTEEHKEKIRITNTGRKFGPRTEKIKEKIRIALLGRHPSEEAIKNMSNAKKGKNHPLYGTHRSKKTKEKLRKANLGKHHSKETLEKMSISHQKRKLQENVNLEENLK